MVCLSLSPCLAQWGSSGSGDGKPDVSVGLIINTDKACPGYTLFSPLDTSHTYLIDNQGVILHAWDIGVWPNNSVYLDDSGVLLHTLEYGGVAYVDRYSKVEWLYYHPLQHHDIEILPNGNILMIVWDVLDKAEALFIGRDKNLFGKDQDLWIDSVLEINPKTYQTVWEWHLYDHIIQDQFPERANYGVLADHPELVNINYAAIADVSDFTHINAVDYHPEFDQILLSSRSLSEIFIIDHSTTSAEAAGHTGGRYGRGGDLLYRWGNPQVYARGDEDDRQLYGQHDAKWITSDLPGAGHILVFNNGNLSERHYSTVVELELPVSGDGFYELKDPNAYQPDGPTWEYAAEEPESFFGKIVSGAQRLPNGNTLICEGPNGRFFEVTTEGETVWEYINPMVPNVTKDITRIVFRAERYMTDHPGIIALLGNNVDNTIDRPKQQ